MRKVLRYTREAMILLAGTETERVDDDAGFRSGMEGYVSSNYPELSRLNMETGFSEANSPENVRCVFSGIIGYEDFKVMLPDSLTPEFVVLEYESVKQERDPGYQKLMDDREENPTPEMVQETMKKIKVEFKKDRATNYYHGNQVECKFIKGQMAWVDTLMGMIENAILNDYLEPSVNDIVDFGWTFKNDFSTPETEE